MPSIFKDSFVKSMRFIPQTATVAPFRAPIPEISYLFKFGFKPVNDEKISIAFSNSLIEFKFFNKNLESSEYAV